MPAPLSADRLATIADTKPNANLISLHTALDKFGADHGLNRPHRLAHFLAQILHESGNFRYDRELWGPTKAQLGYEGRKDLGNTQPGDGKKFAGHGPIQVTGRANTTEFWKWCKAKGYAPPDFVANPELINTDPWEGLTAIWYWSTRKLNALADENDIEQITKKVNGGLNGFSDRIDKYVRAALVLAGYGPTAVSAFQHAAQRAGLLPRDEPGKPTQLDGDAGPKTRAALHMWLVNMDGGRSAAEKTVKASPVVATETVEVEKEVPVAVVPEHAEKRTGLWSWGTAGIGSTLVSLGGGFMDLPIMWKVGLGLVTLGSLAFLLWKGELIVRRVKAIVAEIG